MNQPSQSKEGKLDRFTKNEHVVDPCTGPYQEVQADEQNEKRRDGQDSIDKQQTVPPWKSIPCLLLEGFNRKSETKIKGKW
jgi:hypothetical protein